MGPVRIRRIAPPRLAAGTNLLPQAPRGTHMQPSPDFPLAKNRATTRSFTSGHPSYSCDSPYPRNTPMETIGTAIMPHEPTRCQGSPGDCLWHLIWSFRRVTRRDPSAHGARDSHKRFEREGAKEEARRRRVRRLQRLVEDDGGGAGVSSESSTSVASRDPVPSWSRPLPLPRGD